MKPALWAIGGLLACVAASAVAADDAASALVPALNWNENPGRFARSPEWVRQEPGYYFVNLPEGPVSLLDILRRARVTGTSTLVLSGWQAPAGRGMAAIALDRASCAASAGTQFERLDNPADGADAACLRFGWRALADSGDMLQINLGKQDVIELDNRPMLSVRLRCSHAGKMLRLRLMDLEGRDVVIPLAAPRADAWFEAGPFAPGLDASADALRVVRALRFEQTMTCLRLKEDFAVELGAVLVTSRRDALSDMFVPRENLGGREGLARAIREAQAVGARVVLAIDALQLPDDCRALTGGHLRDWVARDDKGAPRFEVDEAGRVRFTLKPLADWAKYLASAVREKIVRPLDADGVAVTGLPAGPHAAAGATAMLEPLRLAVQRAQHEGAVFTMHADACTLRWADASCGPEADKLPGFLYATAGILANVPVRSVRTVDEANRVTALGLKMANGDEDEGVRLAGAPGTVVTERALAAIGANEAPRTLAAWKGRLAAARRDCARFFDYWQGGRWCERIVTLDEVCEVYHFKVGREHLYNIVNTGERRSRPIVIDIRPSRADSVMDALTGRVIPVRDGCLSVVVEPHGIAMLHTMVTAASREKYFAAIAREKDAAAASDEHIATSYE